MGFQPLRSFNSSPAIKELFSFKWKARGNTDVPPVEMFARPLIFLGLQKLFLHTGQRPVLLGDDAHATNQKNQAIGTCPIA